MNLSTGYPHSLISYGLPANYPKLTASVKADVVIIGGGISGALCAYYLINAGVNCILVDARTIGLGSTCASTSLLQYELDITLSQLSEQIGRQKAARVYTRCAEAINTLQDISTKLRFKSFQRQPSLFFAARRKDNTLLEKEYMVRKQAGFDVSLLGEKEIYDEFGFLAPSAILSAQGAVTDAYLLTHALLEFSMKKGLNVFDRTMISDIHYHRNNTTLHTINGHVISAGRIVNATGYEIGTFLKEKIVDLNSTYAIASEQMQKSAIPWKQNAMLWNTANPYLYMRVTADNRVIIGGRDEKFFNPHRRDKLIKKKGVLLKRDFERLFPEIEFVPEFSWTGTFGSTKDALPYIGIHPSTPHTYYALGFGGNGITFSVIAAAIITDLILGKKNQDQQLFSFSR